jgi:hypothetical protein
VASSGYWHNIPPTRCDPPLSLPQGCLTRNLFLPRRWCLMTRLPLSSSILNSDPIIVQPIKILFPCCGLSCMLHQCHGVHHEHSPRQQSTPPPFDLFNFRPISMLIATPLFLAQAFLVCYINAIAFATNMLLYQKVTPSVLDFFGRPCYPVRHVQWLHTTPTMIFMAAKISSYTNPQVRF